MSVLWSVRGGALHPPESGTPARASRRKLALALLAAGALSVVLLGYLLHRTDGLERSLALARDASWTWLAGSAGIYLASNTLRALRWSVLLPGQTESFPRLYAISTVHTMVSTLLPARLGELAFPILMRTHAATAAHRSLTMFVVARVLDVAVLGSLFLAGLLVHVGVRSRVPGATVAAGALVAAGLVGGAAWLLRGGRLWSWALRRLALWFPDRAGLLELGRRVQADLTGMTSSRTLPAAAALTLAMVLTRHAYFWAALRAVSIPMGFPAVIVGATFSEATSLLPVHGIAGLGTVEAGWTLGMTLVGLDLPEAVASGLFVHIWSLVLSTALGCFSLPLLRPPPVYSPDSRS